MLRFTVFCALAFFLGGCAHAKPVASTSAAIAKSTTPTPAVFKSPDDKFDAFSDDVLVEHGANPELGPRMLRDYEKARADLAQVFGSVVSKRPVAVICETKACVLYVAGPPGRSWTLGPHQSVPGGSFMSGDRTTIVIVRSDEGTGGHMLHEMIHVEAGARLGEARIPAWFHEGLAFSWANRNECKKNLPNAIDDLRRLDNNRAWEEFTNRHLDRLHLTYCQAFREVDAWRKQHDPDAERALLDSVRSGKSFYDLYGAMLTQTSAPRAAEDSSYDQSAIVVNASTDVATLSGASTSFVQQEGFTDLARDDRPFTIAMWIRPEENSGELVHVSQNPDGTGWCIPFVGFDASGKIAGQVVHGQGPSESEFAVTSSPSPPALRKWTHVALTWSPGGYQHLYINGVSVAATKAMAYRASSGVVYVTWGSPAAKGAGACWSGAITGEGFRGSIARMHVFTKELVSSEIGDLAKMTP